MDKPKKRRLKIKGVPENGRNTVRMRVRLDEVEMINDYRALLNGSISAGVESEDVKYAWIPKRNEEGDKMNFMVKNPNFGGELVKKNEFKDELIRSIKGHAPVYPKIQRKKTKEGHLLIIDIADLHINKYAETFLTGKEYNSKIAVERALSGTKGLIKKASGFNIDKILFVVGNDVLNTDGHTRTTTKGTPQDTDTHWFTAFNIARECYVKCIEMCLGVANVDVVHCPSNHDYVTGSLLAETLAAWFRKSKNITFQTSPKYRKYYMYYGNKDENLNTKHLNYSMLLIWKR